MNLQGARLELVRVLAEALDEGAWEITTTTNPEVHHRLIEIQHPENIRRSTMDRWTYTATVPMRLWISEDDDANTIDDIYTLSSPGPDSLFEILDRSSLTVGVVEVVGMGRRYEGFSGFLAADATVELMMETDGA